MKQKHTQRLSPHIEALGTFLLEGQEGKHRDRIYQYVRETYKDSYLIEDDGADVYVPGRLLIEIKGAYTNARAGLFQALQYRHNGKAAPAICVFTKSFAALWRMDNLPVYVKNLANSRKRGETPSRVGVENARKITNAQWNEIVSTALFTIRDGEFDPDDPAKQHRLLVEFDQQLRNLDQGRIQINERNFIAHIEGLEEFFDTQMEAVHCFYSLIASWDVDSRVVQDHYGRHVQLMSGDGVLSDPIQVRPRDTKRFKSYVESRTVFVNHNTGLTVDHYFSRFDEVLSAIDPEYVRKHGIVFTGNSLSKFALWFVHHNFDKRLSDRYIVFDPAGGSGNLVSSWRRNLKYKVISELEPDLLKTIDRRMKATPSVGGFTIIPRVEENKGLNFLSMSADEYLSHILVELRKEGKDLDKPIAFLVNPPYFNSDENERFLSAKKASYEIHPSIIDLAGKDAGHERYLAFLGQMLNIAKVQMGDAEVGGFDFQHLERPKTLASEQLFAPLVMVFTPTSWLIPRPSYQEFRAEWDKHFKYEKGFIVAAREFFNLDSRFPIAFTIWSYSRKPRGNKNRVIVRDLTNLRASDLVMDWDAEPQELDARVGRLLRSSPQLLFDNSRGDIRNLLPPLKTTTGVTERQSMYDFKVSARATTSCRA